MVSQAINFKLKFIKIIFIHSSLLFESSLNQFPKRFFQYEYFYDTTEVLYHNTTNKANEENEDLSEDPGSYLLAWFVNFLIAL